MVDSVETWRELHAIASFCQADIRGRPATIRAYALAKAVDPNFGKPTIRTEEERKILFGQTAAVVR